MDFTNKTEIEAWIKRITHEAVESRKAKVATTTPDQAIAMLDGIINSSDPETMTEQEMYDLGTIGFVADWIKEQQRKSIKVNTHECKQWLRTLPLEQRQLILDELTACTLRTLE